MPLLTYTALVGLRQDPGRAAESSAGPGTDDEWGFGMPVFVHLWGTRLRRTNGGTVGARGVRTEVDVPAARPGEAAGRPGRGKAATDEQPPAEILDRTQDAGEPIATQDAGEPIAAREAEGTAAAEVSR